MNKLLIIYFQELYKNALRVKFYGRKR